MLGVEVAHADHALSVHIRRDNSYDTATTCQDVPDNQ